MQQRGKMDRIVVVFFHYMIGVGFSYFVMGTKNTTFLSILMGYTPIKRLFAVTARLDKRLRFPDSRKSSTVHCNKITTSVWQKHQALN
jgi:hypothetical protein